MFPTLAAGQLDQPLPAPPTDRSDLRPAPKLTKPPTIKKQVEPVYPPEALDGGVAGDVTLTIDIAADGHVTAVSVATPAGHGFDEAATAAAREMEFFPAEVDGKPSAIRISYTIHFQPQMAHPPESFDGGATVRCRRPGRGAPPTPRPRRRRRLPRRPHASSCAARSASAARASPSSAPTSPSIRRGAASGAADRQAEVIGATDDDGRFEVRVREPGALRVIVSDTAHESCVRDFAAGELAGPTPVEWSCFAPKRAGGLNETRVRARPEHPEETKETLTRAELTTVPGTLGDPLRVLQNMPGVARAPFGLGLLIVRGANPSDTGVFIGGEPIPVLYHFLAGPSVFTANLIDKIDFYPGGFGVRYGRYMGGVVDVGVKSDVGRTLHGAVDINLRDSSAYVEGPVPGGVRTSFAYRRSYIDALLPLVLPYIVPARAGSTFFTVAPVYWDYQARADKDLPGGGRVALTAFGSSDSLEIISGDPTVELASNTHIGFHHVMGEWVTSLGAMEHAPVGDVRLRRSEPVDGRLRRLPALPPPVGTRGHQPALQPDARGVGGAGLRPQLRLGALRRPALPARRPHDRRHDAAADGRRRTLALRHGAGAVRGGAGEHHAPPARRPRPALRLLPRRPDRQVLVGPAPGAALGPDAAAGAEGGRRHLSPASESGVSRPRLRQPEPAAAVGRPVPDRHRTAIHRG